VRLHIKVAGDDLEVVVLYWETTANHVDQISAHPMHKVAC
jgi:hypothetical protein